MPTDHRTARRRLASVIGQVTYSTYSALDGNSVIGGPEFIDSDAEVSKYANCYAVIWDDTYSSASTGGQTVAQASPMSRIRKDGFTPATGTLAPVNSTVWAGIGAGHSTRMLEVYAPLPPRDGDGRPGLTTIINRALAECWDIDMLSLSPSSAGQSTFSLSTAADWIRDDQSIIDVWYRRSGSSADELVPEWRFQSDLNTGQIEIRGISLSTGDVLKPKVYRPLNTWIEVRDASSNATWQTSSVGLFYELDRCLLSEEGIEVVGRAHALKVLATQGDFEGRKVDLAEAQQAREDADRWKHASLPREYGRPVHWTRARTTGLGSGALWPREGSLG